MSPAQVEPGSRLTVPSGNRRLQPEKKEDVWKEESVPTMRTSSPFVNEHVQNDVIGIPRCFSNSLILSSAVSKYLIMLCTTPCCSTSILSSLAS